MWFSLKFSKISHIFCIDQAFISSREHFDEESMEGGALNDYKSYVEKMLTEMRRTFKTELDDLGRRKSECNIHLEDAIRKQEKILAAFK